MDRAEFERLRNLPAKEISQDVELTRRPENLPFAIADKIRIENSLGVEAYMTISFNEQTNSKKINVHIVGIGPICRLDVDGSEHAPYGRCHKHDLMSDECPGENLKRSITSRNELSGASIEEVFREFCSAARINHTGTFRSHSE